MGVKQIKCWGETERITPPELQGKFEKYHLTVEAFSYCSWHMHEERANVFHSVSATLFVPSALSGDEPSDPPNPCEMTWHDHAYAFVRPGESIVIRPYRWHQFVVLQDGVVVEDYFNPDGGAPRDDDIIRAWSGGNATNRDYELWTINGLRGEIIDADTKKGVIPVFQDGICFLL